MKILRIATIIIALVLASAITVSAQSSGGVPTSMRAFVSIFVAYMVGWVAIVAWVLLIAKRLGQIEGDLRTGDS